MKEVTLELLIKSLINDFRDYQKEWLTSHNDIEFDRPEEDLILAFLDDTAGCYISETIACRLNEKEVKELLYICEDYLFVLEHAKDQEDYMIVFKHKKGDRQ